MKNIKVLLYCLLFFSLLSAEVYTQNTHPDKFTFNVVYNRFWQSDSTAFLEIGTVFYTKQIALAKDSTGYRGNIELKIKIKNTLTDKYVRGERFHLPFVLQDTLSAQIDKSIVNKFIYVLECGSYLLELGGFDQSNPSRSDSVKIPVTIFPRPQMVALSDVDLSSNISESTDKTNPFYKNSFLVVPNPTLVFGRMNYPVVFHYVEVHNLNKDSLYTVEIAVKDQNGKIQKSTNRQKRYGVENAVEVGTTAIMNLPSGKYLYQVRILDGCLKEVVIAKRQFFINNPHVKQATSRISVKAAEFIGASADELAKEFRTAKYLATDQEIKMFSNVSSVEGRREFLAKFWSDIESGQHGTTVVTRAIYLDRVITANQRYRALGKEGWQTDRGRVYLLYAEPDEVERFPSSENGKPYEIWNYNQIESGVVFVFIDRNGFGDYTLFHSTKRGEIQDDSWQNYLQ